MGRNAKEREPAVEIGDRRDGRASGLCHRGDPDGRMTRRRGGKTWPHPRDANITATRHAVNESGVRAKGREARVVGDGLTHALTHLHRFRACVLRSCSPPGISPARLIRDRGRCLLQGW